MRTVTQAPSLWVLGTGQDSWARPGPAMGRSCGDWGGLHPVWCDVSPPDLSILPHCLPTTAGELWGAPSEISHPGLLEEPRVLTTRAPIHFPPRAEGTQCSLAAEGAGGKTADVSTNMAWPTSKTWCSAKTKPTQHILYESIYIKDEDTQKLLAALFTVAEGGDNPDVHQWMNEQNAVYSSSGILFSHQKGWVADTCHSVDEP